MGRFLLLLLADLVVHIANVYAHEGMMDPVAVRAEVVRVLQAELDNPTDRPLFFAVEGEE